MELELQLALQLMLCLLDLRLLLKQQLLGLGPLLLRLLDLAKMELGLLPEQGPPFKLCLSALTLQELDLPGLSLLQLQLGLMKLGQLGLEQR